jgi:hypothetical protein
LDVLFVPELQLSTQSMGRMMKNTNHHAALQIHPTKKIVLIRKPHDIGVNSVECLLQYRRCSQFERRWSRPVHQRLPAVQGKLGDDCQNHDGFSISLQC